MSVRLNKLLAQRGLGARRKCDELIQRGAVQVNGVVVREPGTQVEPERDRVVVNGRPLPAAAPLRYFALNKPVGVITTLHDPEGRRTIAEFLPPGPRLYPVGRLDAALDPPGLRAAATPGRWGRCRAEVGNLAQESPPDAVRDARRAVLADYPWQSAGDRLYPYRTADWVRRAISLASTS